MLFHASIPAAEPKRVATVIAKLLGGRCIQFGPFQGAFMAVAGDGRGTAIEAYPRNTEIVPGNEMAEFRSSEKTPHIATHLSITSPLPAEEIFALARAEGWRTLESSRGPFNVIEFWVENAVLIEIMAPDALPQYVSMLSSYRAG